ncbi:hypothetical protein EGH24_11780 [Halonotius terrestris]|uniref:DUF8154 domain-containing protein n=1 Tax=Halonotius terrestris TaxID=2487750 RepID=A0A8J8P6C1_9EURY|nr:hypothetical protein [Halonotius terrestris]TQQ79304.1 hypothetical protein EGH24_11780 [Halonotius terrestris]
MSEDPKPLRNALERASDAFDAPPESLSFEPALDPSDTETAVVQLRTACRLLSACRSLREPGGYHASVVQLSFAAIEHSLESYARSRGETIGNSRAGRAKAFGRAAELGLVSETTAQRLKRLHRENREVARTRGTAAAAQHATAMFDLAVTVHNHVAETAALSQECSCDD